MKNYREYFYYKNFKVMEFDTFWEVTMNTDVDSEKCLRHLYKYEFETRYEVLIELNNIQNVKQYLDNTAKDMNFIINNLNPFTHSATANNFELIKFFLNETEINIDATDGLGNSALLIACEKGLIELVNYLID